MSEFQTDLNSDWEIVEKEEVNKLAEVKNIVKRLTYPQDWISYNEAQTKERILSEKMLLEILDIFHQKELRMKGGRHGTPLTERIYSMFVYTYTMHSSRRCISELKMAQERQIINGVPHFNTVLNYFSNISATNVLKKILLITALPLKSVESDFAIDSSGFSTSVYKQWLDIRTQSREMKRCWKKAHTVIGVKSHIITSIEITDGAENDSPYLIPLTKETQKHFDMKELSADKAYLSRENLDTTAELGIIPYIPFKSNSRRLGRGSQIWSTMYDFFKNNRELFDQKYHKRSNVETVYSMIKRKFGNNLKTKKDISQVNEILMKCICHNLAILIQTGFELGLEIDLSSCAETILAQK